MEISVENKEIDGKSFREIHLEESSLGLSNLNDIKETISKELETGSNNFALNLSDVGSINSSGLGILINCMKMVKDSGGEFIILNPGEKLKHIFQITKLDTVFDILD